jgi:hypothetical protein
MILHGSWVDRWRLMFFSMLLVLPSCSEVEVNNKEARRLRDEVLMDMKNVYETKSIIRMQLAAIDAKTERYMKQPETTDSLTLEEERLYELRAATLMSLEHQEEALRTWIAEEAHQEGKSGWWPSASARAQSRLRLERINEIRHSIDTLLKKSKKNEYQKSLE